MRVCVCVYVRYRTYLNVFRMGLKLLGVLKGNPQWFSTSQIFKKLILNICVFKREWYRKQEIDGSGNGETRTGTGTLLNPEQRRVPPPLRVYKYNVLVNFTKSLNKAFCTSRILELHSAGQEMGLHWRR
jgi:hypothetical protein